ncbi:circadian locomoter output cycles protein kaput-like [Montipora foliosa]|uniref:circadian locomoter output cycles protein kaput-like n=1 Tax=Montipora foliosa TaxID=591990 RepID=UPI0035F12E07
MASDEIKRRNETERKRRNRFNGLIEELALCIADRCHTKKSTQKCSILRITIEYFREQEQLANERTAMEPFRNVKPAFMTDDEFSFVFQESSSTFVFAVDSNSDIVYVSDNVLNAVGLLPSQVLKQSIFYFVDYQHHFIFEKLLFALRDSSGNSQHAQRVSQFTCHFRRGPYAQVNGFESISCCGAILQNLRLDEVSKLEDSHRILVLAKPSNRVPSNTTFVRSDGPETKFTARLSIAGKYEYLDKRVAFVLGFFPSELIGNSLYEYCHHEDLENLSEYHEILLLTGKLTTCYYRHFTKGQSWIWLRSLYHLNYSDWSSQPQAITCLSWVAPYEEVCAKHREILASDREKFAHIRACHRNAGERSTSSACPIEFSVRSSPGVENEKKVETETKASEFSPVTSATSFDSCLCSEGCQNIPSTPQSPCSDIDKLTSNDMIDFQQFLQRLHFPVNLSTAQQSVHSFLTKMYTELLSTINKQNEELQDIQKQIRIEGELRDLLEQLGEVKSRKDIEQEYSVTDKILKKFEEIRRECAGTCAEKTVAVSYELCLKRLEEICVQKSFREQRTLARPEGQTSQQLSGAFGQQRGYMYSPPLVNNQFPSQTQPDVQQVQMEEQLLMEHLRFTPYHLPQERDTNNNNTLTQQEQDMLIPFEQDLLQPTLSQFSTMPVFDFSLSTMTNETTFSHQDTSQC